MRPVHIKTLSIILSALVCGSSISNSSALSAETGVDAVGIAGSDFRKQGKIAYSRTEGELTSSTGCEVAYTSFRPKNPLKDIWVILGHGFMRSRSRMAYLAQHLASWGLIVVSVEFCNSKWWTGNHDLNGADMVAVAQKLKADKVIYVGFSAGGLAAIVAANADKKAIAVLGLDMVDNKNLGGKIAPKLTVPCYGLTAAPSACNANNNGLEVYAASSDSCVINVEDASHCHFEFPMDGKCSFVCGKGEKKFSQKVIQQTILGLTTAFLLWHTRIDENGKNWWIADKQNYEALLDAGYIKKLKNNESGSID